MYNTKFYLSTITHKKYTSSHLIILDYIKNKIYISFLKEKIRVKVYIDYVYKTLFVRVKRRCDVE